MKIPEELQVGIKQDAPLGEDNPLGYARENGTTKQHLKFKENIIKWACVPKHIYQRIDGEMEYVPNPDYKGEPTIHIMDNKPRKGFKFLHSVSRWSTSNKWFEVADPRGFKLQIPADNIASLCMQCHIENGEVQTECIWGFEGGSAILLPITSEFYQNIVNKIEEKEAKKAARVTVKKKNAIRGNVYKDKDDRELIYLGYGSVTDMFKKHIDRYSRNGIIEYAKAESDKYHLWARLEERDSDRTYITLHFSKSTTTLFMPKDNDEQVSGNSRALWTHLTAALKEASKNPSENLKDYKYWIWSNRTNSHFKHSPAQTKKRYGGMYDWSFDRTLAINLDADAPVQSVNAQTGTVVLDAE